ncbi:hypothetical protein GQ600_13459 [Phytophthora cactorum]|nr:hypothetical protein GQ600_13459 [Phytophthora cactorum]
MLVVVAAAATYRRRLTLVAHRRSGKALHAAKL